MSNAANTSYLTSEQFTRNKKSKVSIHKLESNDLSHDLIKIKFSAKIEQFYA